MPSSFEEDLRLHPVVRGYWTDDEMFAATGATSLGLIKSLQREKLIAPGKYKNANGKLSRAWSPADIFRIALAVDVADETGFSLLVAVKILGALGTERIDLVLSSASTIKEIEVRLKEATETTDRFSSDGLPLGWRDMEFRVHRPEVLDVRIVNRELVYLLTQSREYADAVIETPLGVLSDVKGNAPRLTLSGEDRGSILYEEERSVLIVRLSCLADLPLRSAFGAEIYPNVWIR